MGCLHDKRAASKRGAGGRKCLRRVVERLLYLVKGVIDADQIRAKPKIATMASMDAQTGHRVDAEIAELIAEAERSGNERRRRHEESGRPQANAAKTICETVLYPVLIAIGLMGIGGALFAALSRTFA